MKFLAVAKALLELIPILTAMIRAIEEAVPGQGAGEAKLAAVRTMLEGAYKTGSDLSVTFDQLWSVMQPTIGALVMAFNATGWRK